MKRLLLFLFSLFVHSSYAQYVARVDKRALVTFPTAPKEMNIAGNNMLYELLDKENTLTGMVTFIEGTDYGIDSATLAANYNNAYVIDLLLNEATSQFKGMELVSKRKIAKGRYMGYEVLLQNAGGDDHIPYRDLRAQLIICGSRVYALMVLAETRGQTDSLPANKFFESLRIDQGK
jgi:hypothetical protein